MAAVKSWCFHSGVAFRGRNHSTVVPCRAWLCLWWCWEPRLCILTKTRCEQKIPQEKQEQGIQKSSAIEEDTKKIITEVSASGGRAGTKPRSTLSIAGFWELGFWPSFSNPDSHEIFLWSIYIWQHINIIKSKPNQKVIFKSSECKNSFKSDLSLLSRFRISVWLPQNCLRGHLALNIYGPVIGKVWPSYLSN